MWPPQSLMLRAQSRQRLQAPILVLEVLEAFRVADLHASVATPKALDRSKSEGGLAEASGSMPS